MKLYYYKGACSLVIRIVLNELGLSFEEEAVDLRAKKTASGANFLDINPKGAVPTLHLDDGDVLTENQVILQYLADTKSNHQLLAPVPNITRYHTLEWLNFISTELHKSFGLFFYPKTPDDIKNNVLKPLILSKFDHLDKRLANGTYIMGDEFTLPDAYLFVMVMWAENFKLDLSAYKHLNHYIERLRKRPSVVKSLQQEQL